MKAIRRCLRWVHEEGETGTGSADKAVLIMEDSLGVMRDIETVWRAGTIDELRLRHRRAMVEDIVRLRPVPWVGFDADCADVASRWRAEEPVEHCERRCVDIRVRFVQLSNLDANIQPGVHVSMVAAMPQQKAVDLCPDFAC